MKRNNLHSITVVRLASLASMTRLNCRAAEEATLPRENTGRGRFIDEHVHFHDCQKGDVEKVAEWIKSNQVQRCINLPSEVVDTICRGDAEPMFWGGKAGNRDPSGEQVG